MVENLKCSKLFKDWTIFWNKRKMWQHCRLILNLGYAIFEKNKNKKLLFFPTGNISV